MRSLLAKTTALCGMAAFGAGFDLEWCEACDTSVPCEVEISTNKLAALAGVAAGTGFSVAADGRRLAVLAFDGKMAGTLGLRFRVPEGTRRLVCEVGTGRLALTDSAAIDNLFAGALKAESLSRWTLPAGVEAKAVADGIEFWGTDAAMPDGTCVAYTVDLPPALAGKPALQEIDLTGLSVMARGGHARIRQLDAAGHVLPETVVDERWTTHMRPNGKLARYRDAGHFHRSARQLRAEFELRVLRTDFDAYGMPLQDVSLRLPRLRLSRLAVRPGLQLPFPRYDDANFVPGVTGRPGDYALVSGGARHNGFFYQTRSRGAWAGTTDFRKEEDLYFPSAAGTVEAWFRPTPRSATGGTPVVPVGGHAGRVTLPSQRATRNGQDARCPSGRSRGTCDPTISTFNAQPSTFNAQPSTLNAQPITLFEAYHGYSRKLRKGGRGVVMRLSHAPDSGELALSFVDWTGRKFERRWKAGGFSLPEGRWTHVALQWKPGGAATVFCGGRKCATLPLKAFSALPIATAKAPNELWAMELYVGTSCAASRLNDGTKDRQAMFQGAIDELRVSSGCRYGADFEPKPSSAVAPETRALFGFDRTFDGVSGGGFGFIPGSFHSQADRIDHGLLVGGRRIDYFPSEILPANDPRRTFDVFNLPDVPDAGDYHQARRLRTQRATLADGGKMAVTCPEGSVPAFVEIANASETVRLDYPILVNRGRLDPRSFGDLADSLSLDGLDDRARVNRVFQYALSASDYFMVHPLDFAAGSDMPQDVVFNAMVMLNGYCGFDCGPLNNLAANMFTTVAGCLASQTYGYGHSFEQVFFEGKNHIYDLSAQQFFPAFDNETAAYLEEAADQPGLFNRYRKSCDHFIRKGATREATAYNPAYREKIGVMLNPGERLRITYMNDGTANNLHTYARKGSLAYDPSNAGKVDYGKVAGADDAKGWVLRVDRIFPQYSTAVLTFDGAPPAKSPALERVDAESFCYRVQSGYPITWAEYSAERRDGRPVAIEISTDFKTFRPLPQGAAGVSRLEYLVKGRHEYLLRFAAPLAAVRRLSLRTHAQVNLRTYPGWTEAGENALTFRALGGGKAEVTVAWREPAKRIEVEGCVYSGALRGCERSLVLMDPAKGLDLSVKGVSPRAVAVARGRVSARLVPSTLSPQRSTLKLSYAPDRAPYMKHGDDLPAPPRELPAFAAVDLVDGEAKLTLTVIISPTARLLKASAEAATGEARFRAADDGSVQPRLVLSKEGDGATCRFERLPPGRYVVFPLVRYQVEAKIENLPATASLMLINPHPSTLDPQPSTFECSRRVNGCEEFLKAPVGKAGGRSRWKWDTSSRWDLKGQKRWSGWIVREYDFPELESLSFRLKGDLPSGLEFAAALVLPAPDAEFILDAKKLLFGLNCEP